MHIYFSVSVASGHRACFTLHHFLVTLASKIFVFALKYSMQSASPIKHSPSPMSKGGNVLYLLYWRNFIYPVAQLRFVGLASCEGWEIREQLKNLPGRRRGSPRRFKLLFPLWLRGGWRCDGDAMWSPRGYSTAMGRETKKVQEVVIWTGRRSLTQGQRLWGGQSGHRHRAQLWAVAFCQVWCAMSPRGYRGTEGLQQLCGAVLSARIRKVPEQIVL